MLKISLQPIFKRVKVADRKTREPSDYIKAKLCPEEEEEPASVTWPHPSGHSGH